MLIEGKAQAADTIGIDFDGEKLEFKVEKFEKKKIEERKEEVKPEETVGGVVVEPQVQSPTPPIVSPSVSPVPSKTEEGKPVNPLEPYFAQNPTQTETPGVFPTQNIPSGDTSSENKQQPASTVTTTV